MSIEIRIPSILRIGGGSFGEAGALLVQLGCKKPLIVTDGFLMKTQLAERLQKQIKDAGMRAGMTWKNSADSERPPGSVLDQDVAAQIHRSCASWLGVNPVPGVLGER